MKIIHTADIHLDSPLVGVADGKARRQELISALTNLADYAENNGVQAVIVAGDLFDDEFATEGTIKSVAEIVNSSSAEWFVLQGNHGDASPYRKLNSFCPKVKYFGTEWTAYDLDNVTVCGKELLPNSQAAFAPLPFRAGRYNIVVLHGDVDSDTYGRIDKNVLAASGANYVALGHRHTLSAFKFGKVAACYCGALEPRGFDEGPSGGFVVIDTDKNEIKHVPQSIRSVIAKRIDVTSCNNDVALQRLIADAVADVASRNYLNLILCGKRSGDVRVEFTAKQFLQGKFFALRIQDQTVANRDLSQIATEVSLRGEFVRLVDATADARLKDEILELGLTLLDGGQL